MHFDYRVDVLVVLFDDVLGQVLRLILGWVLMLIIDCWRDLARFLTTLLLGEEPWRRDFASLGLCTGFWRSLVGLDVRGVGAAFRAIKALVGHIVMLSWRPRTTSSAI